MYNNTSDLEYMTIALALAEKGRFTVSPNPMVGCVIVKNHCVIGEGFHERAGGAHAEVNALTSAGLDAKGATAYVPLNPAATMAKHRPAQTH